jgi:sphingomyelin phosphodiesterase
MPTCCRESQGIASNYHEAAGYWGDYRDCDSSLEAIRDALDHIKEQHSDADYVYFTGDVVDHGVWETSEDYITKSYKTIMDEFFKRFPKTPVYFALGNHETHPLNV